MVRENRLSNGVRVYGEYLPDMRSVTIGIWAKAGSVMETQEQNGISHYIEHMLFKGTERRGYQQIAAEIDNIGGQANAFTAKEMTCYYVKVMDERLSVATDVLCDMFCHSVFDAKEMEKEKGVILEEIAMSNDNPEDLAHEKMAETFFAGNAIGKTILGPAENVRRFTREDIREYMDECYYAENVIVAVVGNYDEAWLLDELEKKLGGIQSKGAPLSFPKDELWKPERHYLSIKRDVEQAHVGIGFPAESFLDPRKYALSAVANLLGGSMSSRLFQKIREEMGMAYSIYCYPAIYSSHGMLAIYAGTSSENAPKAVRAVLEEVKRLKKELITPEELHNTKEQLRGNFILGQESSAAKMNSIGKNVLLGGSPLSEEDVLESLNQVDMDAVREAVDMVFDEEKMTGVFVGAVDHCGEVEDLFS